LNTPSNPIDISIIIINWNTRELLARCLSSIELYLREPDGLRYEVFVVDNASSDHSARLVRDNFPGIALIENESHVGFAAANNQALRLATGEYILFLNSDTELMPGAIDFLKDSLDRYPEAGAAGPMVHNVDGSIQNCYGELPNVVNEIVGPNLLDIFNKPWGRIGRYLASSKPMCRKVERVAFACTLTRRVAQQEIGELDERFTFYSEDFDWFKRLQLAGWSVLYCPSAHIKHHGGASSNQRSNWAISQLFKSKRLYFRKYSGTGAERLLRIGLSLRFLAKVIIASLNYLINPVRAKEQIRRYSLLLQDTLVDMD